MPSVVSALPVLAMQIMFHEGGAPLAAHQATPDLFFEGPARVATQSKSV